MSEAEAPVGLPKSCCTLVEETMLQGGNRNWVHPPLVCEKGFRFEVSDKTGASRSRFFLPFEGNPKEARPWGSILSNMKTLLGTLGKEWKNGSQEPS